MEPSRATWLTPAEERAWRAWRAMHVQVSALTARDLQRDSSLSEPDYEVLSTLSEKPGHRWQLRELADKMRWSRSRLSHHVARMETRELVVRERDTEDRRDVTIRLTPLGEEVLEQAAPAHVASVRRWFVSHLTADELEALATVGERVAERLAAER